MDMAFGGQGAPIVPIGEKLLMNEYDYLLNLGGIANISRKGNADTGTVAFDVSPANRVLNMLANEIGKEYDAGGAIAATGIIQPILLEQLNALDYYHQSFPKSLANDFGTDIVYPLIKQSGVSTVDALRTFVEHITVQINNAINAINNNQPSPTNHQLLATGGGAFNDFLIQQLQEKLLSQNITVVVPAPNLVNYKEALVMALIGVLRWRQEYNVLSSVTGASRDSIGGALWNGDSA
jgi:anhydro-N-acetylmuramic acid kinase